MSDIRKHPFWRSAAFALPGCLTVGLITFICFGLRLNLTITSFFYLIIVVLQSLTGDFVSAAIVSVVADLCLNFFFVPPLFSFRVSNSYDFWALVTFLVTGLVITRQTSRVRQEGRTSELQRQEMNRLYELAQQLLALEPLSALYTKLLATFRTGFGLSAVCLFDASTSELHVDGDSLNNLSGKTRDAYISGKDNDDPTSGTSVRCLRVGAISRGAIGFEGLRDPELTANPLAALATAMLERIRAFHNASHAAAAAETEVLRGAILDALAHEFKTPLATIVTAAGGLREIGPLDPAQLELAEVVEMEASRLGVLTSRLLRTARLDREELKPQLEIIDIADLVANLVAQYSERWTDRNISVTKPSTAIEVFADPELLPLAIRQLLDNACKYSQPGSDITVAVELRSKDVAIRVSNRGSLILQSERARVFERFYRGAEARIAAPGSGLGLYIARKIVHAHGGTLKLETETKTPADTSFDLVIPTAKSNIEGFAEQVL
jgi:two-component system sensor histidine kinase KdpD